MQSQPFLLGRQPIFDAALEVYGYELLFGAGDDGDSEVSGDEEDRTANILVHAGLDIGIDRLVGSKLAFVNVSRAYVVGELPVGLDPEQTVIEVPAAIARDAGVIAGAQALRDGGYRVALDAGRERAIDPALLELAAFVKLDARADDMLEQQVAQCSPYPARLVAEKVMDPEQLSRCAHLGFTLFQGHLLSRPNLVGGRTLSPAQVTCLRLIEQLRDPEVSAGDVASMIETDPGLSYRFLHAAPVRVNEGNARKLNSIREGIVLLGTRRLRDWVALMLLAGTHIGPVESITIAMTRARMAELLAQRERPDLRSAAFTAGMLSAFDIVLGVPLAEIVQNMAISEELVAALLERSGVLGAILADVLAWEVVEDGGPFATRRNLAELAQSYVEALAWANEICASLDSTR